MVFSRWLYGILSFPFLIFNVPIFLNLLTHSKSTAYDSNGNCVPPRTEICYIQNFGDNISDLSTQSGGSIFNLSNEEEEELDL